MREMDMNTLCRLCLGEKSKLLDVFASHVIQGLTAADTIMELLQIQVSASDAYPHCVCIECLKILEDFKLFKQRCESNKDLLDRAYARKLQVETNEELMGMAVPCDVVIKEECIENPSNEQENAVSTEFEEYVYDSYETSSDKLIESANPVTVPIKCEYEDQTSVETDLVKVPHTSSVKKSNEKIPEVNSPSENIVYCGHSVKEEVEDITNESCSSTSFEEVTPWASEAEKIRGDEKVFIRVKCLDKVPLSDLHTSHKHIHSAENPFQQAECSKAKGQQGNLKTHVNIDSEERIFTCSECSWTFSHKSKLRAHLFCLGDRRFICDECSITFLCENKHKEHIKTHSVEKPFHCTLCCKGFLRKDKLKVHMSVHSEDKQFNCNVCSRSFSRRDYLNIHMRTHSGERPYQCDQCGKSFATKGNLNTHSKIHSGEKPHECDRCKKSFSTNYDLKKHTRTHTGEKPYKCGCCGKSFSTNGNLKKHIRVHTGERPYECHQCGKRFSDDSSLKKHSVIHSGQRDFVCSLCSMTFTLKVSLNRHLKRHYK